jgi:hypothetical protein
MLESNDQSYHFPQAKKGSPVNLTTCNLIGEIQANGKQQNVAFKDYVETNCFQPVVGCNIDGDWVGLE